MVDERRSGRRKRVSLLIVGVGAWSLLTAPAGADPGQGNAQGHGANVSGAYDPTGIDGPGPGLGNGAAVGQPGDGTAGVQDVNPADTKNPAGQMPELDPPGDANAGYECEPGPNVGVGQGNPAHTSCAVSDSTSTTPPVGAVTPTATPSGDVGSGSAAGSTSPGGPTPVAPVGPGPSAPDSTATGEGTPAPVVGPVAQSTPALSPASPIPGPVGPGPVTSTGERTPAPVVGPVVPGISSSIRIGTPGLSENPAATGTLGAGPFATTNPQFVDSTSAGAPTISAFLPIGGLLSQSPTPSPLSVPSAQVTGDISRGVLAAAGAFASTPVASTASTRGELALTGADLTEALLLSSIALVLGAALLRGGGRRVRAT
jgi:hypothetical protein